MEDQLCKSGLFIVAHTTVGDALLAASRSALYCVCLVDLHPRHQQPQLCAWILWERTDDVTAGVTKTWSPIGAPETLPACEAFRTEQFVELEAGDYSRKIVGATVVET